MKAGQLIQEGKTGHFQQTKKRHGPKARHDPDDHAKKEESRQLGCVFGIDDGLAMLSALSHGASCTCAFPQNAWRIQKLPGFVLLLIWWEPSFSAADLAF
jgi:hypothetical protein